MDNPSEMKTAGQFEDRYLAFLETITQLRPQLHRYCSRMTGSVLDGEDVVQPAFSWKDSSRCGVVGFLPVDIKMAQEQRRLLPIRSGGIYFQPGCSSDG